MPSRNTVKQYVANHYYHIYNRGVEKRQIFMDERDYKVFLSYFKVALSDELPEEDKEEALSEIEEARLRRLNLSDKVDLLAYCLMPNHFHLLIFQKNDPSAITQLMRSCMNGYVRYFNKRHKRVGSLFQGRYKASLIDNESYLWHISRYIHLNPRDWETYPYSSFLYYTGKKKADWVEQEKVLSLHRGGFGEYRKFLEDYEEYRQSLAGIKDQLAD